MKKILIFPEHGLRHIFWLLHGFSDLAASNVRVYWANSKWLPDHMAPIPENQFVSALTNAAAMTALADGEFDAVVFSDGTTVGHLAKLLPSSTIRVYLDSIDPQYIMESCLRICDIYLKCQYPADGQLLVGNEIELAPYANSTPVVPWPYCCGGIIHDDWFAPERNPSIHFRGWCYPPQRTRSYRKIIESGLPVSGGLYGRSDCAIISKLDLVKDKDLLAPRIDYDAYIREMTGCLIALNFVGNGQVCFRTHEIWRTETCCVSIQLDSAYFPGIRPVNGVHWVECRNDDEIISVCRELLSCPKEAQKIGESGKAYWNTYCSAEIAARRLLELLGIEIVR